MGRGELGLNRRVFRAVRRVVLCDFDELDCSAALALVARREVQYASTMIIWGTKSKQKLLGTGHFACPACQSHAPFSHVKLESYFTLYFIPLFAVSTLAEYVSCGHCGVDLRPEVLTYALGQGAPGGWGPPQQGGPQQGGWGPPQQGGPQQGGWGPPGGGPTGQGG